MGSEADVFEGDFLAGARTAVAAETEAVLRWAMAKWFATISTSTRNQDSGGEFWCVKKYAIA